MSVDVSAPTLTAVLKEKRNVRGCMDVAAAENRRLTRSHGLNSGHEHNFRLDRDANVTCGGDKECAVLLVVCNYGGCSGEWEIHSVPLTGSNS